jgi:hypothetical protein
MEGWWVFAKGMKAEPDWRMASQLMVRFKPEGGRQGPHYATGQHFDAKLLAGLP